MHDDGLVQVGDAENVGEGRELGRERGGGGV